MSFFSTSNRTLTRDSNRIVSPRRRRLVPILAVLTLLNLGTFAGGVWLGRDLGVMPESLTEAQAAGTGDHFAVTRVGQLAGRLKTLESDVLALQRMLGEQHELNTRLSALDPSLAPLLVPELPPGQGGILLPPRGCVGAGLKAGEMTLKNLEHTETSARCMRLALDAMMQQVAERNAALMAIPSTRPVGQARLASLFGNRIDPFKKTVAFHSGVDFALPTGSDVFAAAGGRVSFVGRRGAYGNLIIIDHGNRLVSRYAHLSRMHVRAGEVVTPGQRVGEVGSTGRSTGPHLHFEVLHRGQFVDPQRFLALGDLERADDAHAHD